jgi:Arc/MetJ-type ribon-helix-helix transcriptional regulator
MHAIASQYRLDMWENQTNYVEVWIEKEALAGIFEPVCHEMRVPFFCCRGYTSQSEMWRAGIRLKEKAEDGKTPVILHFGDHDPSGIDMTRDVEDRLGMFMEGEIIEVNRLALNMDQVRKYKPPPNPAKMSDSRSHGPAGYIAKFGRSSWELDALNPPVLHALVRDAVRELIDDETWEADAAREKKYKGILTDASRDWEGVAGYLGHETEDDEDE